MSSAAAVMWILSAILIAWGFSVAFRRSDGVMSPVALPSTPQISRQLAAALFIVGIGGLAWGLRGTFDDADGLPVADTIANACAAAIAAAAVAGFVFAYRGRRASGRLCPACGYDLTATPTPTCPECGHEPEADSAPASSPRFRTGRRQGPLFQTTRSRTLLQCSVWGLLVALALHLTPSLFRQGALGIAPTPVLILLWEHLPTAYVSGSSGGANAAVVAKEGPLGARLRFGGPAWHRTWLRRRLESAIMSADDLREATRRASVAIGEFGDLPFPPSDASRSTISRHLRSRALGELGPEFDADPPHRRVEKLQDLAWILTYCTRFGEGAGPQESDVFLTRLIAAAGDPDPLVSRSAARAIVWVQQATAPTLTGMLPLLGDPQVPMLARLNMAIKIADVCESDPALRSAWLQAVHNAPRAPRPASAADILWFAGVQVTDSDARTQIDLAPFLNSPDPALRVAAAALDITWRLPLPRRDVIDAASQAQHLEACQSIATLAAGDHPSGGRYIVDAAAILNCRQPQILATVVALLDSADTADQSVAAQYALRNEIHDPAVVGALTRLCNRPGLDPYLAGWLPQYVESLRTTSTPAENATPAENSTAADRR